MLTILVIVILVIIVSLMFGLKYLAKFDKYLIRFILVGGFNTFNYYLLFIILNDYFIYILAHIVAFIYSAICSYFLSSMYTFKKNPQLKTLLKFPLTYLPNLIGSTLLTYVVVKMGLINDQYASLLIMFLIIPITFIISKIIFITKE